MLSIEKLSFSYGENTILNDVTFDVSEGENTVVLGVNGEGKTTLLRCVCGLFRPDSGSVRLNGRDITKTSVSVRSKLISYVPQLQHPSDMSVFETVLSGRRTSFSFLPSETDKIRAAQALEMMGIGHIAAKRTCEISGGELRKVSVARALCSDTKLILMDEPTANLDIGSTVKLTETIKKVSAESGVTFLVTMHDITAASRFASNYVLMKNGFVADKGGADILTPQNIKSVYGVDTEIIKLNGTTVAVPK